jgi:hypothetical protein
MRLTIFRNVFNRRNQPINIYAGPDERLYNSEDESESDQVPSRRASKSPISSHRPNSGKREQRKRHEFHG